MAASASVETVTKDQIVDTVPKRFSAIKFGIQ